MLFFLLIDDSQAILNLFRKSIERKFDAHIDCAHNGREALKKLGLFQYDVILSDIEMPEMNGMELYKELKERHPVMAGRVAFISGNVECPEGLYLKEEGLPLLAKPFKLQELLTLINSVLNMQGKAPRDSSKRIYPRKTVNENCVIEPFVKIDTSEQIGGMTINYSEGGMCCIAYNGEKIRIKENVFVSAETLGIQRKEAEVVWSSTSSEFMQFGLKWVSKCSTSSYH